MKSKIRPAGITGPVYSKIVLTVVMVGMVMFSILRMPDARAAKGDTEAIVDKSDKVSAVMEIVKNQNWIGKESQLTTLAKFTNLKQLRTQAVTGTPFGIVSIEGEYFDPVGGEYVLLWRESFEPLLQGNGYSVTYEFFGEDVWIPFTKREIIADNHGTVINFNGYTFDYMLDSWVKDEQGVIEYDGQGRPVSVIEEGFEGESWVVYGTTLFTYNSNGSISYEENYEDEDESYVGTISQQGNNVIDEYVEDFLGDMYYYRDTYYNISLNDYLKYEEYYFSWLEMDYEEKVYEEEEYELMGTYRLVEESSDQKIFLYSELFYGSDSEESMEPSYRDVLNYNDGKIATYLMEDYDDGDWMSSTRYTYSYDINVSNEANPEVVENFTLSQNYPNPFNPTTSISYDLPEATQVKLQVFDLLGHEVSTLVNAYKPAGHHTIQFDAASLNSGIYIYRIEAGNFNSTRKMLLVK